MSALLALVTRGGIVESRHTGSIVVCDASGRVVWSLGDPGNTTFWRSAAKPIQAVPLIESGAVERFGFTGGEIAVMASSHAGEAVHVGAVLSILGKIGLGPEVLACGVHPPFDKPSADALVMLGEKPSELHSDCSGKHAGMLALALQLGVPIEGYWKASHPVQEAVMRVISRYTGVPADTIPTGIDGCGVPVFALPLGAMATAYARLLRGPGFRVLSAMMEHPHMVAGTGRFCTELMEALPGRVAAKSGAEGIHCLALPEHGLGMACKIDDGSLRAMGPVVIRALETMGVMTGGVPERLARLRTITLENHKGEAVGGIIPAF